jgi:hypothetical protein
MQRHNFPGESDEALLCNFATTIFKRNPQGLAASKTFEYRTTQALSQKWKFIQRDGTGRKPNITRRDNTPVCTGARDFQAAERSGGATIGRWPKNCMAPGPDGQQTQLVQKIERDKHPLTASQQRSSFRCTSLLLERISQSDLHNPWLTLNLREVVKITGRS